MIWTVMTREDDADPMGAIARQGWSCAIAPGGCSGLYRQTMLARLRSAVCRAHHDGSCPSNWPFGMPMGLVCHGADAAELLMSRADLLMAEFALPLPQPHEPNRAAWRQT
jgi:hypothetical protein